MAIVYSVVRNLSFVVLAVLLSMWTVWIGVIRLLYPYSIDYGEGLAKLGAIRFLHFNLAQLYPHTSGTELVTAAYPPLFYSFSAVLMDLHVPAYLAGRSAALASAAGICLLIYKSVMREAKDRWIAVISAAVFLAWYPVFYWMGYMRADFTAALFALSGLYLLFYRQRTPWGFIIGCFLLSVLAKHSFVIAPIVAGLVLFWNRAKHAWLFLAAFAAAAAAVFAGIQFLSDGRFFDQIIYGVKAPVDVAMSLKMTQKLLGQQLIFIGLAVWGSLVQMQERKGRWGLYFLLSFLFAAWSVGKDGSGIYYFIESAAAGSIVLGLTAAKYRKTAPFTAGSLIILLAGMQLFLHFQKEAAETQKTENQLVKFQSNRELLEKLVNQSPGNVLADEPGILADSNKRLDIESFEYKLYIQNHVFPEEPFIQQLENGSYALAVLSFKTERNKSDYFRYTAGPMRAVADNFHLIGKIDDKFIYMYNGVSKSSEESAKQLIIQANK